MKKRIISLFLVAVMLCTLLPLGASAATASGTDGNISWSLDSNGTLTISGTGAMKDYFSSSVPWHSKRSSIKSVFIGDSVTSIGNYAFFDCYGLTSVTIPDSVTSIGSWAFYGCSGLTGVYITDLAAWCGISSDGSYSNPLRYAQNLYLNGELVTDLVIPDTVTSIGNYAFADCSGLTSVTIPDSVQSIGGYAFSGCSGLTSVTIPDSVTSIGEGTFKNCSSLTSVTIPDSVQSIGDRAFYKCSSLTSVTIPDSVTSIGGWAFSDCSGLASVTIGNGVTSIGSSAFYGCSGLASVTIGNSVQSIGEGAFADCSGLTSVTIPDSVQSIGYGAFYYCSGLTSVTFSGSVPEGLDGNTFKSDYASFALYVPAGDTTWTASKYFDKFNNTWAGYHIVSYVAAPVVSITTSAGKPKLSWNAVDGATKYWVYRSTDGKNFKYYDMTTSTTYINKSTSIGTTYYYQVKAVKVVDGQNVVSDLSNIAKIMCAPSAPTVSISRSNGKPKLSWSAVSGATKYWIYRSTDGGKTYKYFDCTTKTSYTNSGAASGTTYYYKVKAVAVVSGNNVTSAYSSAKSLFTSLATPTAKITTSNGKPKISWNAVTGVDKYYIYRSTDGKNFTFFDSTKNTSYTNTGAKKGTKYYYKVKAVCTSNSNANSAQSKAVSVKATK